MKPAPSTGNGDDTPNYNQFVCTLCHRNLDSPAPKDKPSQEVVATSSRAVLEADELASIDAEEVTSTSCGHMFHKYCLVKKLNTFDKYYKNLCPTCLKVCGDESDFHRLYPNTSTDIVPRRTAVSKGVKKKPAENRNPGGVYGPARTVVETGCTELGCVYRVDLHSTVVYDYNALCTEFRKKKNRLPEVKGELEARTKELAKEQERHKKLSRELAELKAAAAEEAGPSDAGPSGDGRRRSGRRSGHAVE